MVHKKDGSKFFWYDFRFEGRRYRGSTKQETLGKARTYESLLLTQFSNSGGKRKPVVLRDFAPTFLQFVQTGRLAEKSKEYYANGWRLLKSQPIAGMRLHSITSADAAVVAVPGSGSNINNALRTLRRILSLAEEKGIIGKVPRIALVEEQERKALITASIDLQILTKANLTLRGVYMLVADCGIRPADCVAMRWEDVDFSRADIFIRGGKTGKKAQRYVPMTARVREMLMSRAPMSNEWVFASPRQTDRPMKPRSIATMFSIFKSETGLPQNVVLYSARHTFATDLTEATGNLVKTQKALGHTSLSTTARYNHSRSADVSGIMEARNTARLNELWPEEMRPQ